MLWPRNDIEMTWNAPASVGLGIGNGGNTPGIRYGIFVQPRQLPTTNVRPLGRPSQPASRWESPNINRKRQCWRRYDDMMFCTISPGRSHWLLPGQGIFGGRWKLLQWWWGVTRRGLRKERQQGPTAYPAVSCRCWRCWRCPPCHVQFGKGWCPERQDKKTGGGYLKISISTSNSVTTCYNILHHVGHHVARSCNSSESSPQVSNATGILDTIEPYFFMILQIFSDVHVPLQHYLKVFTS